MKVIDFHTHIFPDELAPRAISVLLANSKESRNYTNGTYKELQKSMQTNGISTSVLLPVATKPSQVTTINRSCLDLKGNGTVPFGSLHPETKNIEEEISFLLKAGIPGVKFHPEYQDFYVDDPSYFGIYEQISAAGLIAVFHTGKDPGPFTCDHCLPDALARVHRNFPRLRIVAAHMGGWRVWDDVRKYLCGLPIYFDTSAVCHLLPPDDFVKLARKHGIERVLFGSDSPWFDQGESRRWIEELALTDSEKEMILSKNTQRLLTGEIED
ncbi:MAG: amidohydrolase family protein [Fibrobacter sp.]|jgi:predicted TIM-barrel fold metal-dependent hydrolase|nr:amidohydrolase family protein [Fibrobacter sp.]HON09596.1 amidohydrolase family protein [Chitinispirillaceae bacterium]